MCFLIILEHTTFSPSFPTRGRKLLNSNLKKPPDLTTSLQEIHLCVTHLRQWKFGTDWVSIKELLFYFSSSMIKAISVSVCVCFKRHYYLELHDEVFIDKIISSLGSISN